MLRLATAFGLLFLVSGVAAAQNKDAKALAEEGQGLLDQGNVAAACAKLAESARIEPKVATQMLLASCYERAGRTASAWTEYQVAAKLASKAGDKEWQREMIAIERARALEKKLVRLTITAPAPTPGLVVRRGGEPLPAGQLGVAVPVDPGEITVTATAPGFEPFTMTLRIAKQKLTTVEVPALKKGESPAPPPASPETPPPPQT